jgi:Domain of unknown function (DUF4388)
MALKGKLQDFSLHQLLNLVNLAHKTGALTVRSENGHGEFAYLYFREGKLIHATFDGRPARLTDILIKVGKITPEQAQLVRDRSRVDTDKELGLLLIHNGYLSQQDIIQSVRGFLLDTIYQLFTWQGGSFVFEPNQLPPEECITIPLNLENVIMEGGRRQQELEKLRGEIPDLDVPLRFAERPNTNIRNINLSMEEWRVISFINSRNTLRQIAQYLGLDDFKVRQVAQGLRRAGLVEMVPSPATVTANATGPRGQPPAAPRAPAPGAKLTRGVIMRIINGIRRR